MWLEITRVILKYQFSIKRWLNKFQHTAYLLVVCDLVLYVFNVHRSQAHTRTVEHNQYNRVTCNK